MLLLPMRRKMPEENRCSPSSIRLSIPFAFVLRAPGPKGILLTGPGFESKEGITLHPMHMGKTSTLDLPAHSAGIVWKR